MECGRSQQWAFDCVATGEKIVGKLYSKRVEIPDFRFIEKRTNAIRAFIIFSAADTRFTAPNFIAKSIKKWLHPGSPN